jgi:nucleotidyltransferase substrate binding protein (TIGR01987 family)
MIINTEYYERCTKTLENALAKIKTEEFNTIDYEMYRSACVKEFEIILEQSGKLLRKILKPYFSSPVQVDRLNFKDLFRHAALRGLMSDEACERWLKYRDSRNNTAHDYGVELAEEALEFFPQFVFDALDFVQIIKSQNDADQG